MNMDELGDSIHRTWIDLLLAANLREVAAIVADAEVIVLRDNWTQYGLCVDLPPSTALYLTNDTSYSEVITSTLTKVAEGHLYNQDGVPTQEIKIEFRTRLMEPEANWREVVKVLVANAKDPNQGVITEKTAAREGRRPYIYNEMKFGSNSEIRIAQELERRKVLFFPLPLAVRADTGKWTDRREPDFVVCQEGVWGILEIAYHPDRYEQDKQKDAWFKHSGILCVEHATAEQCYNSPSAVVDEFLSTLAKHKR